MATASLVSTCAIVTATQSVMSDPGGYAIFSEKGFYLKVGKNGVHITKAPSLGGTQAALTFPLSLDDARGLALNLLRVVA